MEQNKTGKYLKYALGEIVLVVIGILIALSINTWNQKRITKLNEIKTLIEMVQNLNSNLEQFENNVKIEKEIINNIVILIDYVENKKPYDPFLMPYSESITWWEHMTITSSTYEGLKANNFDVISSNTLKNDIIELFEVHYPSSREIINTVAATEANSLTAPMILKYELFNAINYAKTLNDFEYLNYLYARKRWKTDVIKINERVIPLTKKLIKDIEKELKTIK